MVGTVSTGSPLARTERRVVFPLVKSFERMNHDEVCEHIYIYMYATTEWCLLETKEEHCLGRQKTHLFSSPITTISNFFV